MTLTLGKMTPVLLTVDICSTLPDTLISVSKWSEYTVELAVKVHSNKAIVCHGGNHLKSCDQQWHFPLRLELDLRLPVPDLEWQVDLPVSDLEWQVDLDIVNP